MGNAGKDAEARHLDGGNVVASFTIATSEVYKDRSGNRTERTEWHNVKCFGKIAEFAEKFVRKGSAFFVCGRIKTEEYTTKDGARKAMSWIVADSVQFAGTKPKEQTQPQQRPAPQRDDYPADTNIDPETNLPF